MNLKFLHPNRSKIIVSLIIFLVFVPFIEYDTGIRCSLAPCPSTATGSVVMYTLFSYNSNVINIFYFNLIVGAILSYLISCVLMNVINRRRNT